MLLSANAAPVSTGLVIGMGLGIVFLGLICIIAILYLMGMIVRTFESKTPAPIATAPTAPAVDAPIENKQEFVAAVSAAIAEELGTDVSAIRIKSIKKI